MKIKIGSIKFFFEFIKVKYKFVVKLVNFIGIIFNS